MKFCGYKLWLEIIDRTKLVFNHSYIIQNHENILPCFSRTQEGGLSTDSSNTKALSLSFGQRKNGGSVSQ